MKHWFQSIFFRPGRDNPTDKNILRLLMPSAVGIFLCMVCLAGTTWAWFSASIQAPPQTITAANFDVSVSITGETTGPVTESADGGYALKANQTYTVTLTAAGTASGGGYCNVIKDGTVWRSTGAIEPGNDLTFTLLCAADKTYHFAAEWGKYTGENPIQNGSHVDETAP